MHITENQVYLSALRKIECDSFCGKTVLIAGATGMIGSCIVDTLMEKNKNSEFQCKVIAGGRNVVSGKNRFSAWWDKEHFNFVEMDVNGGKIDYSGTVDYIIHAASNADPVKFATEPVDTLLANVVGTKNLLEFGRAHDMKRFLYISSGEMYGQPNENLDDFVEDYCGPINHSGFRACYPAGKRAAEVLCQSYIAQYGIDAVIVRPCHIFGPTMTKRDSRAVSEFFRKAALGENIILKSSGLVERSHCAVFDAVGAILKVISNGTCGEAYNIADKQYQMTIRGIAQEIANSAGVQLVFENPSDIEAKGYSKVSRAVLVSNKLDSIGWKTTTSNLSAIKTTLEVLKTL